MHSSFPLEVVVLQANVAWVTLETPLDTLEYGYPKEYVSSRSYPAKGLQVYILRYTGIHMFSNQPETVEHL
jgi:hypothetical protein